MNANLWLSLLIVGVVLNVVMQQRIYAENRRRDAEQSRKLSCVLDVLVVWAQTWGQDSVTVGRHLQQVIDHYTAETTSGGTRDRRHQ